MNWKSLIDEIERFIIKKVFFITEVYRFVVKRNFSTLSGILEKKANFIGSQINVVHDDIIAGILGFDTDTKFEK